MLFNSDEYSNIIPLLTQRSYHEDDINILIGVNGCGKSRLLRQMQEVFRTDNETHVLAIANTVYDKFTNYTNNRSKLLTASKGKQLIKDTLHSALQYCFLESDSRLSEFARPLIYTGFKPMIGFSIRGIDENFREKIINSKMSQHTIEEFMYFLNRYEEVEEFNAKTWIDLDDYLHGDMRQLTLLQIFLQEKLLKNLGIIKGIDLFLNKKGMIIPINEASSGELSIISGLLFISTHITSNTVILIDEPENSLHPKWQIEYIKNITDLFWLHKPKIIIATHSPLIVDGAKRHNAGVRIFQGDGDTFHLRDNQTSRNVEEMYEDYFNVITPENRYLAEQIIDYFNKLVSRKLSSEGFIYHIEQFIQLSYDEKQKDALYGALELARKINRYN